MGEVQGCDESDARHDRHALESHEKKDGPEYIDELGGQEQGPQRCPWGETAWKPTPKWPRNMSLPEVALGAT